MTLYKKFLNALIDSFLSTIADRHVRLLSSPLAAEDELRHEANGENESDEVHDHRRQQNVAPGGQLVAAQVSEVDDVAILGQADVAVGVCVVLEIGARQNRLGADVEHANARRAVDEDVLGEALLVVGGEADVVEGRVDERQSGEEHGH